LLSNRDSEKLKLKRMRLLGSKSWNSNREMQLRRQEYKRSCRLRGRKNWSRGMQRGELSCFSSNARGSRWPPKRGRSLRGRLRQPRRVKRTRLYSKGRSSAGRSRWPRRRGWSLRRNDNKIWKNHLRELLIKPNYNKMPLELLNRKRMNVNAIL
jgi:hypothetical protein